MHEPDEETLALELHFLEFIFRTLLEAQGFSIRFPHHPVWGVSWFRVAERGRQAEGLV